MRLEPEKSTYETWSEVVIWAAVGAIIFAFGIYLLGKIRGRLRQSERESGILLDNFRDLHSRGELSDEEYRTIKSKLASQLRKQWEAKEERES